MKQAVIKITSKQYLVSEGQILEVPRLNAQKGEQLTFNEVLLLIDGEKIILGQPTIIKSKVIAEVLSQEKGDKLRVSKFKAKSRYRRVMGFRPQITKIKITQISA